MLQWNDDDERRRRRKTVSALLVYARLTLSLSCRNSISSLISNLILPQSLSLSLYGLRLFSLPFWESGRRWTSFRLTAALIERSYARCFVQSLQMKRQSRKTVLARGFPTPPLVMMHSTGLNCISVISHSLSLSSFYLSSSLFSFFVKHAQKLFRIFARQIETLCAQNVIHITYGWVSSLQKKRRKEASVSPGHETGRHFQTRAISNK